MRLRNKCSRVADMPRIIDNHVITVTDHILIRSQNRSTLWDSFETIRENEAIKSIRQRCGVNTIIGHEQRKCNIGMVPLRFYYSTSC